MTAAERPRTIAAIVPTFNRRDRLPRLLQELSRADDLDEIVVVVDGARDGSLELLHDLAKDEPRLRTLWTENAGPTAALLTGAEAATADVVVNLDDDIIPTPGMFAGHLRHHQSRPGLVVTGYAYMFAEPWRPGRFARESFRRSYESQCARWEAQPETILTELWSGNVSFRRSDLLRVRAENPPQLSSMGIFQHSDWELGLCCLLTGLEGVYDPDLRATHEFERSFAGFISDARSSGRGRYLVESLYPDLAETGGTRRKEPVPVRLILALTRSSAAGSAVSRLLVSLVKLAGMLRLQRAEWRLGSLIMRLEQERGRVAAAREFKDDRHENQGSSPTGGV